MEGFFIRKRASKVNARLSTNQMAVMAECMPVNGKPDGSNTSLQSDIIPLTLLRTHIILGA
jgi:hypothetical protein